MTDKTYKIAVLPGDGIGPEVMAQAHKVLDAIEKNMPSLLSEKSTMSAGLRSIIMVARCQKALSELVNRAMRFCSVQSVVRNGNTCRPTINLSAALCCHCVNTSNCFVTFVPRKFTAV